MSKLSRLNVVRFLIAIAALVSTSLAIATPQDKSAAIEQLINRYEVSLNTSDTPSIMKLYGKDPIFMPQHSMAQVGRDAVKKAYESVFTTIDLNIKFTIYEIEVHGDKAWARTSSAGKTIILANGAKINEGNNELFIFKKENSKWKIHRYLFSTTTPRQNP
jgi:uncharacterized protein (TIGR02246 family)